LEELLALGVGQGEVLAQIEIFQDRLRELKELVRRFNLFSN